MNSNNKPYCIVPWGAVSILPNGDVIPCMASNTKLPSVIMGNIRRQTFAEIWTSEKYATLRKSHHDNPFTFAGCGLCKEQSKLKPDASKRTEMWDKYGKLFARHKVNFNNHTNPKDILFLDMALSSLCNLACTMCSSSYSTSWLDLDKKLAAENFDYISKPTSISGSENIRPHLTSLFKYLNNLHFLFLKGGEPLLNKDTIWFLEELVERKIAPQVVLAIVTNGTIYNEKIAELISHFKGVDIVVSLDAVGDLYNYIRGGNKFTSEDVISNIKRIKKWNSKAMVTISPSLQAYNALRFSDVIEQSYYVADEVICNNWVTVPFYQSIISLPEEMHPLVVGELEKSIQFLRKMEPTNKSISFLEYIIRYLRKEIPWLKNHTLNINYQLQLQNYTRIIDRERGMKLSGIIPEMGRFLE